MVRNFVGTFAGDSGRCVELCVQVFLLVIFFVFEIRFKSIFIVTNLRRRIKLHSAGYSRGPRWDGSGNLIWEASNHNKKNNLVRRYKNTCLRGLFFSTGIIFS